ncbi:hypothetical protein JJE00_05765 [Candidatus Bathyarchaeota archaeon]|nr:hypothetical protein [Candidatus Bathyarchaeota archaeon]
MTLQTDYSAKVHLANFVIDSLKMVFREESPEAGYQKLRDKGLFSLKRIYERSNLKIRR